MGKDTKKCQIIDPPNLLAVKAPLTARAVSAMIADAERAVEALRDDYADWAEQDLRVLEQAMQGIVTDTSRRGDHMRDLHRIAFDMPGLAGSFDYPLITVICASLCKIIDMEPRISAKMLQVLQAHVDAVRTVIKLQVRSDGGETGCALIQELTTATATFAAAE